MNAIPEILYVHMYPHKQKYFLAYFVYITLIPAKLFNISGT